MNLPYVCPSFHLINTLGMRIKNFFLLVFLLANTFLGANNTPNSQGFPTIPINQEDYCDLPAPFNFQAEEVGPTWVKYSWLLGSPLSQYEIKTFRASDGFLLNTTITPAGSLSATINGLPAETECYGEIRTMCGLEPSIQFAQSQNFFLPILEIIVNGINPPNGSSDCPLVGSGSCTFPDAVTTFMISNRWDSRKFGIKYEQGFKVTLETVNGPANPFRIRCQGNIDPFPNQSCFSISYFELWYKPVASAEYLIGQFTASRNTSQTPAINNLILLNLLSKFQLDRIVSIERPEKQAPISTKERASTTLEAFNLPTATPNPFSQALDITLGQTSAAKVILQLINLSGQVVLHQTLDAGQQQYTLSTEHLSPGFYFLRIEADGEVQTLKVIKSE